MIELKSGAGLVVAGDVRNTFAAVDDALLNQARMYVSVLEATKNANIPASQAQRLLKSLTSSMAQIVEGRAEAVEALKQMIAIKEHSNLAPVSYGCPIGWEDLKASAPEPVTAREDA